MFAQYVFVAGGHARVQRVHLNRGVDRRFRDLRLVQLNGAANLCELPLHVRYSQVPDNELGVRMRRVNLVGRGLPEGS